MLAADEVARHLGVEVDAGLAADEVVVRRRRHGPNRLPEPLPRPAWKRLLDQFSDFMILVLLAAALLSGVIGDLIDTLVIVLIVALNAAIGFWQEWRADQALQAGMHHDGMHYFPLQGSAHGLLAMNHEYLDEGLLFPDGMRTWSAQKVAKAQKATASTRPAAMTA